MPANGRWDLIRRLKVKASNGITTSDDTLGYSITSCFFFVACIVIQLRNVHQQNALFIFNSILLVFYMFRTSYVHHQEDYIIHATLYSLFSTLKLQPKAT